MIVLDYVIPGTWIDSNDEQWARKIEQQIIFLEAQFRDANIALNMFNTFKPSISYPFSREKYLADLERKREIRAELVKEITKEGMSINEYENELNLQTEIHFKREKWDQGSNPIEFENHRTFIYARAYLNALDNFDRLLKKLVEEKNIPSEVGEYHKKISTYFPDLRPVRNTMQHLEDRSRGLDSSRPPKPMNLKKIDNNIIHAPNGGVLVFNTLNGSNFEATKANGELGRVEISKQSLEKLHEIFTGVLNSFIWKGPKQHKPTFY
ncbi:hypothetical protein I6M64_05405 [Acinetobacter lactucae]|uniref:Uncharacterized protein n=1 Tax=Acinetobacter lactucae TaxID=1785128 RepID=A0ABS1AFP7_9GAMM|nr:hypothetical protein [Acinetobacter lactucae]MBJ8436760.1 hypothetical protein [Acinetobacter lactucae]